MLDALSLSGLFLFWIALGRDAGFRPELLACVCQFSAFSAELSLVDSRLSGQKLFLIPPGRPWGKQVAGLLFRRRVRDDHALERTMT